eukprot:3120020-Alexandrium_andersonii.AAC.1
MGAGLFREGPPRLTRALLRQRLRAILGLGLALPRAPMLPVAACGAGFFDFSEAVRLFEPCPAAAELQRRGRSR